MKYPVTATEHAYLKGRQRENLERALRNPNENWFFEHLKRRTSHKWTRQALWGYRIFDFWCHALGIAVEVDGATHNAKYDEIRDSYNLNRSGILVLRVRNLNEEDADRVIDEINAAETWGERRKFIGLNPLAY